MNALWRDSQTKFISRIVKSHDRNLYAERHRDGFIVIYEKSQRTECFYNDGNVAMYTVKDAPKFVCALTDNWTTTGKPRDWGAEVVLTRLREHDLAHNDQLFEQLDKQHEKAKEGKQRDIRNKNEAWLSDNRSVFKKAFSDIRVANMDKSERRRRRFEKRQELRN